MITKIQSFIDVITNSSSSVFIMREDDALRYDNLENTDDGISIKPIDFNWVKEWGLSEVEAVMAILEMSPEVVTTWVKGKYCSYWEDPDPEAWNTFVDMHEDLIKERFKDLYWVDIEDHFVDAWDVTQEAIDDSLWYDSRH
jgi:hypothetical protein